jgi:hypothetical protein
MKENSLMVLKEKILAIAEAEAFDFADSLGRNYGENGVYIHIDEVNLTCLWLMLKR